MKIHGKSCKSLFLVLCFIGLGVASTALAGTPAYLSSYGNDSYPCTLQQTCRTLPAALAKTVMLSTTAAVVKLSLTSVSICCHVAPRSALR